MAFHGELRPIVQLVGERGAHGARLQAQRVAAEVGAVAAFVRRYQEFVAERAQRVGGIGGLRPGGSGLVVGHG